MSKNIGIIVDGQGDYAALKRRFSAKCRILKTDGPRGHTADLNAIATGARKQVGILKSLRCRHVILMVDLEERREAWEGFCSKLKGCVSAIDFGVPVTLAVPNRMIENWYLADIAYLSGKRTYLTRITKQKIYEGKHGKKELRRHFRRHVSYSETRHGPDLFATLRIACARNRSRSLNAFLLQVERSAGIIRQGRR